MCLLAWKDVVNKLLRKKVDYMYHIILNDCEVTPETFNYL